MEYSRRPSKMDEIVKLISRTPSGRGLLERFLPLYTRQTVRLSAYPQEIVDQLRAVLPEGQPIGACFTIDSLPDSLTANASETPSTGKRQGTIYLDLNSPLGVVAPFLVHEMAHALDPQVWNGKVSARTQLYRSEQTAFEAQHRFVQELKERDPQYAFFLEEYYPKARVLHQALSLDDITDLYSAA